jgi:hypothetical protein
LDNYKKFATQHNDIQQSNKKVNAWHGYVMLSAYWHSKEKEQDSTRWNGTRNGITRMGLLFKILLIGIYECCKYFIFSIMSFFGYQSFAQPTVVQTSHRGVTAVHSAKDR